jgi:hypothetical protein
MTGSAHSYDAGSPHGTIGEEAVKLAEAVQDWLGERTGRAPRDVWATATGEPENLHSPECRVCPLCRAMRFFSTMNPQVLEHLTDAAMSLGAAMRAMGEDGDRPPEPPAPPGPAEPASGDGAT